MVGKKSEDGYVLSIVVGLSFVAMSIFAIVLQYLSSLSVSTRDLDNISTARNSARSGLMAAIKGADDSVQGSSLIGSGSIGSNVTYDYKINSSSSNIYLSSNGSVQFGHTTYKANEKVDIPITPVVSDYKPIQMDIGDDVVCAVSGKKVYCWGDNSAMRIGVGYYYYDEKAKYGSYYDWPVPADTSSDPNSDLKDKEVDQVSAGRLHVCATSEGKMYCWGNMSNSSGFGGPGQYNFATRINLGSINNKRVDKVSAGYGYTCIIAEYKAYCLGQNKDGVFGNGSYSDSETPLPVSTDTGIYDKQVTDIGTSVWNNYACAIAGDKLYCWGKNNYGQLGTGDNNDRPRPFEVGAGSPMEGKRVEKISLKGEHTCAIAEGRLYCWGRNDDGQLGTGDTYDRSSPVDISNNSILKNKKVTDVSTSHINTCVVADSKPYCWGRTRHGGSSGGERYNKPVDASSTPSKNLLYGKQIESISAGDFGGCASLNSWIYCWGRNDAGSTGTGNYRKAPDPVSPISHDGALRGGNTPNFRTSLAVSSNVCSIANNKLYCWGRNINSSVGDGTSNIRKRPVLIAGEDDRAVVNGRATNVDLSDGDSPSFGCAVISSKAYCWGENTYSNLGDGTSINRSKPVPVIVNVGDTFSHKKVTKVTVGKSHACAIAEGNVYCWGAAGTLGNGLGSSSSRAVLVSADPASGLHGKTTDIVAGGDNTCALADKKVYCWGKNLKGESSGTGLVKSPKLIEVGDPVNDISKVLITVSNGISCAVDIKSQLYCWGTENRLGYGSSSTNIRIPKSGAINAKSTNSVLKDKSIGAISSSSTHICVIANNVIYCWGNNNYGQLGDGSKTSKSSPVAVKTNGTPLHGQYIRSIATGENRTCAATGYGIYCWGLDGGFISPGNSSFNSIVPTQTNGLLDLSNAVRY